MSIKRPTFRPYHQNQRLMLPPSLEDLIAADHSVWIVNDVINRINSEPLLKAYHIREGSNYHPLMLLKVLVYGYLTNIYVSRKLAKPAGKVFLLCGSALCKSPITIPSTALVGFDLNMPCALC